MRKVEEKEYTSAPKAPFTTSTLQQEAGRKLGMTAKRAMQAAQRLYENGYITYMRTDSMALSTQAIERRAHLVEESTAASTCRRLRASGRASRGTRRRRTRRSARPARAFRRRDEIAARGRRGDEARLYDLIWKRTVAWQMVDARMKSVVATFDCELADGGKAELVARGRTVLFDGFLRAYVEG